MHKCTFGIAVVVAAVFSMAQISFADEAATKPVEKQLEEKSLAAAAAAAPSLVRVEYTLQYDKGQAHNEEYIAQERPMEEAGFLLAPDKVLTGDLMVHPRFIKEIHVRFGEQVVKATPAAWATAQAGMLLTLESPLKDAKPLAFDATKKGPYLAIGLSFRNGRWITSADALSISSYVADGGKTRRLTAPTQVLVTDEQGTPVGILLNDDLPADDTWKGSPLEWNMIPAPKMAEMLKDVAARADRSLLRVTLSYRSPRKGDAAARTLSGMDEDEGSTEVNVTGILTDKQTLLVLANMNPKTTSRLERITVYPNTPAAAKTPATKPADGAEAGGIAAKFSSTLSDYGCFVATLEKPLDGAVKLGDADLMNHQNTLLMAAEVIIQGEKRITYFSHDRIGAMNKGWHGQLYPSMSSGERDRFYFDADGQLLIVPVSRREKVALQERFGSSQPIATAARYLVGVMGDLAKNSDPHNVPLTEQQESRLAWLGVELQPLDRELARACGVSDLTSDGSCGAVVSYVYENSPAAKEGVKAGDILLRLHVEGQPKPIDVKGDRPNFDGPFPWDRLEELPEQYYDRVPTPWNSAENTFTRALTDLGFGKKFSAEIFRDGNTLSKSFTVMEAPQHYMSAASYKSTPLGLTVRDMTYEVRRYFQKKANDPGVIAAIITPGSKASVAGLKPFEVITHVDDQPVNNAKDFEKLTKDKTEIRLSVNRMSRGRTVKITMTGATTRAAAPKATKTPPPEDEE